MPFKVKPLTIPEVVLIEPSVYTDDRGFFMESYKYSEFVSLGIDSPFVQDNHSRSTQRVLRGLHFQKAPMAQAKLVRALRGSIFDVAVDIRKGSPTYGQWVGVTLSEDEKQLLYVPVGFAHGFCALTEVAEVIYKVTKEFSPHHEQGILWNDPDIAITWPIDSPIITKKDLEYPKLKEIDSEFVFGAIS